MNTEEKRAAVRERYGSIAEDQSCGCGGSSCCGDTPAQVGAQIGYQISQLDSLPDGANLGLGCGNPTAIASLTDGETAIDLGSGAGIDCFLASREVGPAGHVIGVDMTPSMLSRARTNAETGGYANVEFRLGEIEHLPVADATAHLVMSNCVINLSVDKAAVFREAFRVLKPGGRLSVSDIVLDGELPDHIRDDASAYSACIGGAIAREEYVRAIENAGFTDVSVVSEKPFAQTYEIKNGEQSVKLPPGVVTSVTVTAAKRMATT